MHGSRVGRLVGVALVFLAVPARAQALVQLQQLDNASSAQQVTLTNPVAVSGALLADSTNQFLEQGSTGEGAADLTTGTVRVYSSGKMLATAPSRDGYTWMPIATAAISDTITIAGPGSTVTVTLTFVVDGTLAITPTVGGYPPSAELYETLSLGCSLGISPNLANQMSLVSRHYLALGDAGPSDMTGITTSRTGDPTATVVATGLDNNAPVVTMNLHNTVTVGQPVSVGCSTEAQNYVDSPYYHLVADLGNTGRMSITLPPGYSYTSTSGVLLTQADGGGLLLDGGGAPNVSDGGTNDGGSQSSHDAGSTSGDAGATPPGAGGCNSAGSGDSSLGTILLAMCAALIGVSLRPRSERART